MIYKIEKHLRRQLLPLFANMEDTIILSCFELAKNLGYVMERPYDTYGIE